jgi:hypothetical protein
MPFETWNCLITVEIFNSTVQYTNQYVLIFQPNFSRESDANLTDKIEIKTYISLLCLTWVLRSEKKSLEELCVTDGYGIISLSGEPQMLQVPNQRHCWINYSLSIKLFTIFQQKPRMYLTDPCDRHVCIEGATDRGSYLSRNAEPTPVAVLSKA